MSVNKKQKTKQLLYSTTIDTVVAKHLKNSSNIKLNDSPLRVLIETGTDESFVSKKTH